MNNLNDGMAWGLLPLFYASHGLAIAEIGVLAAAYPAVWGLAQIGTGAPSRIGSGGRASSSAGCCSRRAPSG